MTTLAARITILRDEIRERRDMLERRYDGPIPDEDLEALARMEGNLSFMIRQQREKAT